MDEADLPPPGVPDEEQVGKPAPWPFAEDIPDARPPKPDLDTVASLLTRALARWESRNESVDAQQGVFYRRRDGLKPGETEAVNPYESEHEFVRSAPVRRFDRTVSLIEPHAGAMRLQKRARRRDDSGETAQKQENFIRAQWALDERDWQRERVPHGQPPLSRAMGGLATGQGGLGFMLRVNPENAGDHPFTYIPIPVTELHPVDDWVLRITELPLADVRASEPELAKAYPKLRKGETIPPGYPDDGDIVRLVSGGDRFGRWHFKYWDWGSPKAIIEGGTNPETRWLKEPTEINYPGFGIYQLQYWNASALPVLGGRTAERAGAIARGIFSSEMDDVKTMDRLLGITISLAEKSVSPDITTYYDPNRGTDPATGVDLVPPSYDSRPGADNKLRVGENRTANLQSAQGAQAINTAMSFLNAEQADAQPPAMSGLGRDASGFQSVVRQEAGETLHVEPMRRFFVSHMEWVDACRLALCWQFGRGENEDGTGEKKRWTKYRVTSDQGDDTLTAAEIALEGPRVQWSYRDENEPVLAAKQHRLLELHAAGGLPMFDVLDELGYEEPEVKHRLVLKEKLLQLPWVEQTLAFWEIAKKRNKSLTAIAWNALQHMPGGAPQMPGMPSQPGGGPGGAPPQGPPLAPMTGQPNPGAGGNMGQQMGQNAPSRPPAGGM